MRKGREGDPPGAKRRKFKEAPIGFWHFAPMQQLGVLRVSFATFAG